MSINNGNKSGKKHKNVIGNIITLNFGLKPFYKNVRLIYLGLFLIFFICVSLILSWKYFPTRTYKEGEVTPREILAPRTFEVEDIAATREAQIQEMNSVKPVYRIDTFVQSQVETDLKTEFTLIKKMRSMGPSISISEFKKIKSQLPISLSDSAVTTFINADSEGFEQMQLFTSSIVSQSLGMGIRERDPKDFKNAKINIQKTVSSFGLPEDQAKAIIEIASLTIKPNARIDWEETSRKRQERRNSVQPIMITIKKGQVIVGKGQIITPEHIRILEGMGVLRSQINWTAVGGILIFTLLLAILLEVYIRKSLPALTLEPRKIMLIIIVTVGIILLTSLLVQFNPYWAPVPIATILIAVLISPRLAMMIAAILAIIVGVLTGEVNYGATALLTGMAAALASWNVHRRMDLIAASIMVFMVNEASVAVFSLMSGETLSAFVENLVYGGVNGFSSGTIAIGLLPILEYLFGITTSIKLMEISNQSEPLIKRLLMEAPGTYHHSVIVGNLAEAGAEAINEDPLLCRAASYYHDIGKLARPYFYIENQLGQDNPHDKLSPTLSALVIISHVKEGVELGRQHSLPAPVLDIIAQHHGTSLITYFYHKAKQAEADKEEPSRQDFSYPGPRPMSKAAGIVMMADISEAATRSLEKPTPQKIENLIKSLFKKSLEEGQLDETPLSLKDINDLINTFTRILTGIYHYRIEYPDKIMEEVSERSSLSKITPIKAKVN